MLQPDAIVKHGTVLDVHSPLALEKDMEIDASKKAGGLSHPGLTTGSVQPSSIWLWLRHGYMTASHAFELCIRKVMAFREGHMQREDRSGLANNRMQIHFLADYVMSCSGYWLGRIRPIPGSQSVELTGLASCSNRTCVLNILQMTTYGNSCFDEGLLLETQRNQK